MAIRPNKYPPSPRNDLICPPTLCCGGSWAGRGAAASVFVLGPCPWKRWSGSPEAPAVVISWVARGLGRGGERRREKGEEEEVGGGGRGKRKEEKGRGGRWRGEREEGRGGNIGMAVV